MSNHTHWYVADLGGWDSIAAQIGWKPQTASMLMVVEKRPIQRNLRRYVGEIQITPFPFIRSMWCDNADLVVNGREITRNLRHRFFYPMVSFLPKGAVMEIMDIWNTEYQFVDKMMMFVEVDPRVKGRPNK